MSRKEKVLRHIDKNGYGIEVGPSHNPIAPRGEGFNVDIIDHMCREELVEKYRKHGVDIDKIEDVDFIWRGESYPQLTGKSRFYDWIIASHVIEHTPDLIGFFNDCGAVLKEDGIISLVVPDKRYCFDHYRPLTGIAKVIDSHVYGVNKHTPGTVAEYYLNVISKGGAIAWDSEAKGNVRFVHSLADAATRMNSVLKEKAYDDVHAWCFVPHSFRLLIQDLFALGLIPFKELEFLPTSGCEFYMTLSRKGRGPQKPRLEMLEIIEAEITEAKMTKSMARKWSEIARAIGGFARRFNSS